MDLGVIEAGEVAKLVDEYGLEGGERYLEVPTARIIHPINELAVQEGEPFDDLGTRWNRVADLQSAGPIRKEGWVREAEHLRADAEERIEDRPVGVEHDDILASARGGAAERPQERAEVTGVDINRSGAGATEGDGRRRHISPASEEGFDQRNRVGVGERPEATLVGMVGNRVRCVPAHWHAIGGDGERATADGHTRSRQQHNEERQYTRHNCPSIERPRKGRLCQLFRDSWVFCKTPESSY